MRPSRAPRFGYDAAAMFEKLTELIEKHPNYGPAMKEAAVAQAQLILDYHTHGPGTGYCVSIAKKKHNPLKFIGQAEPLIELVHIKGVGQEESQCFALMNDLGRELMAHYQLKQTPLIYLNKHPYSADG